MHLEDLSVSGFRNLNFKDLRLCEGINVFYGANGSGKTSILESIFYLSRLKSFRTNRRTEVIDRNVGLFTIFSKLNIDSDSSQLGCSLDENGNSRVRLNGSDLVRVSEVTSLLPVQVITPESFDVFWKSPKYRRSFFDFGLFHVEQSFYRLWQEYSKVTKQINVLLKNRDIKTDELLYWYRLLHEKGNKIDELRERFVSTLFLDSIETLKSGLSDAIYMDLIAKLSIAYKSKAISSESELINQIEKDRKYKQIGFGPNRADYRFLKSDQDISKTLSRGQSKMVFYLLVIVMVNLIKKHSGKDVLMLIDDLPSEVDIDTRKVMLKMIVETGSQVLVTSIEDGIAKEFVDYTNLIQVFHVEHGTINNKNMEQLCP